MVKPVKELSEAEYKALLAWLRAGKQYALKYSRETYVDLSEMLTDTLNLVALRYPDTNLLDEEWLKYISYYLDQLTFFMSNEMELDDGLVQPLHEIKALLYDLHKGRRNVHIPQVDRRKDSGEKSMLMGRVVALVTLYKEHGNDKTFESASRRAARFLKAKHIIFDSGGKAVWLFIKDYHRDIRRNKRDRLATDAYNFFTGRDWVVHIEEGLLSEPGNVIRPGDLIKIIEQDITTDYGGRDLRAAAAIK